MRRLLMNKLDRIMRIRLKNLIGLVSLVIIFTACEGSSSAKGVVKDKETNLPLDSVTCTVTSGEMQIVTNSTGEYDVHNNIGGCVGGCKDIVVEFSRNGYKTVVKVEEEARGIVYMEK